MRLDQLPDSRIGFKPAADGTIALDRRSGEIVNVYARHKTPLELWRRNGLGLTEYEAGIRYGALWRQVYRPRSPAHSDTTRVVVDGGGPVQREPERLADRSGELSAAQAEIGDPETVTMLNRLCGLEDWPADKRRLKRKCRRGLEVLTRLWRRR